MKRIIVICITLVMGAVSANAQGLLGLLKDKVAGAVSEVAGVSVKGDWTYQGSAVELTGDSALSTTLASASTGMVESKIDEILAKVGINPGIILVSFGEDGTCSFSSGNIVIPGTYTLEGTKLDMNFSKLFNLKMEGKVTSTSNGIQVVFVADKFLAFVEKTIDFIGQVKPDATITALGTALSSVKGAKLGFKLSK